MVTHYLGLHLNIVSVSSEQLVQLKIVKPSHVKKAVQDEVMLNAATNLIMASYRNQLLHVLVRPAIIALCINNCAGDVMSLGKLSIKICFCPVSKEEHFQRSYLTSTSSSSEYSVKISSFNLEKRVK